jgi:uncharacterized membrane protein
MNADLGLLLGPWATYVAIAAMVLATYPMRVGGFWLMAHVPLTPRVRRILEALPGAVVVATVLPILAREGVPAAIGIAAALVSTLIRRNDFVALIAGVAAAALARYAGLG